MRLLAFLLATLLVSCNDAPLAQDNDPGPGGGPDAPQDTGDPGDSSGDDPTPAYTSYFDPDRAWSHLVHQVELGFRVPGTPTHRACRRWLEQQLGPLCESVEVQEFVIELPAGPTKMWNVIGRFRLEAERRIILGAHWDTRPTADRNPYGERDQPIAGANDGASGVAVLLELARVLSEVPPPVGVDIVLFDGEDYGPSGNMMFFGSKFFAKYLSETQVRSYNYGILLDMVGDKQLDIHPEYNSEGRAGMVFLVAYQLGRTLGYSAFKDRDGYRITDDHVPLLDRGVRMYDFIDFNYEYWHTTEDTVDKCSKESLEAIGRIVENLLYLYPDLYAPEE